MKVDFNNIRDLVVLNNWKLTPGATCVVENEVLHCCPLGAIFLKEHPDYKVANDDNNTDEEFDPFDWIYNEFGAEFTQGFMRGFDGSSQYVDDATDTDAYDNGSYIRQQAEKHGLLNKE